MSAVMSTSTIHINDLLNVVKSRHYLVIMRTPDGIRYYTAEYGTQLLVLPGDSIIRVADVRIRPLDIQPPQDILERPEVKQLSELVGKPPALKLFQYTFVALKTKVVQRLDTGAEFHEVVHEQVAPAATLYAVHAHYIAYRSNSGRLYSEIPGGARAYWLAERRQLQQLPIYVRVLDKHRREVGIKIPIDEEQVRQLMTYLFG
jgi:hypothetical protein